MNKKRYSLFAFRLIATAILVPVATLKFSGSATDVELFQQLGMEPHGRIIIGVIELTAGFLLMTPYAATGALLAVSVMLGAIIAHSTFLGFDLKHSGMLIAVLVSSAIVLIVRRAELPLVGRTLAGDTPPMP